LLQYRFSAEKSVSDPNSKHVLIIGKNLTAVGFEEVASKLQPAVDEEVEI